ncbi:hypothetical protein [Pseudomonas baetica]|jgi:hypothetical protein|uniref:hypothetical protein n=1 Tax=Pseudomonas baetica TaxID=674054 RepID=UPI0024062893|nr:hypothetical protein [Pseudomonas baetica]MDF9778940.1 hypothetical protein [Pseudomonas baetica]
MIYEREIIPKGSTVEWGYVFKECVESENEMFVLMLGVSAELSLQEIEASFKANDWAAKAICAAFPSLAGGNTHQGAPRVDSGLVAGGEVHMRIASAVMKACQRAVDKSRSLENINLENVVEAALRQG